MLMDAAERAEDAAKEMLACVTDGSASSAEMRQALKATRAFMSIVSAFQTNAAAVIAMRERHGDGGRHVLADAAGLSRRDAHAQVKAARVIQAAPSVRDAVESGRVSIANAKRLAEAVDKTSAAEVESDSDLLAKAESMRPEDFAREARRWAAAHQDDGGEANYQRLRAKRSVRVWDADDGTVELHGKFDPVTGRRIGNRLKAEARRLYDADKKNAKCVSNGSSAGSDNGRSNHADTGDDIGSTDKEFRARRSFDQCMADALDALASNSSNGGGKPFADICVVAHVDDDTGKLIAELPDGVRLPQAVLEEFSCNAKFTGVVYDREGNPIWRAHSVRTATEAQRQILIARYGGCFHCGANPAMCQIHHIKPVSQGGATSLKNMVPVCWDCHNKIHHHNWQIHTSGDGLHTLHPPSGAHYGPERAPDPPTPRRTGSRRTANQPQPPQPDNTDNPKQPPPRPPDRARTADQPQPDNTDNPKQPLPRRTDRGHAANPASGSENRESRRDEPQFAFG